MCRTPVTLGGGITMAYAGRKEPLLFPETIPVLFNRVGFVAFVHLM
jgi:hypothetical protein